MGRTSPWWGASPIGRRLDVDGVSDTVPRDYCGQAQGTAEAARVARGAARESVCTASGHFAPPSMARPISLPRIRISRFLRSVGVPGGPAGMQSGQVDRGSIHSLRKVALQVTRALSRGRVCLSYVYIYHPRRAGQLWSSSQGAAVGQECCSRPTITRERPPPRPIPAPA